MKPFLLLCLFFMVSCNIENRTIHKTLKHKQALIETTGQLILQYKNHGKKEIFLGVNDSMDRRYANFLDKKLNLPWVHIIYDSADFFINTDSVVLFTRTGLPIIGNQHNILVDYKQVPRDSFNGCGSCSIIKKIGERLFYLKAAMPAF